MQRRTLSHNKDSNARATHVSRARDDSTKKGCNASGNSDCSKRNNMETLAQGEHFDGKDVTAQEKGGAAETRDDGNQLSSGVVSSTQDDCIKRPHDDADNETAEDDVSKRKKRKDNEEKEPMGKPAPVARGGPGRILTGSKPPGPASKTGAIPLGKNSGGQNVSKGGAGSSGKGNMQAQGKGGGGGSKANAQGSHQGKSGGGKGGSLQVGKQDRKSPVASPKPNQNKDNNDGDEDTKTHEAAPKVPPLKIVIPGGAGGSGNRNEQEGEGQRGSGLNTTATVYNPKVWALPHTQQVFIAPAIAPVVNHSLGPLNVALSQTVSQPSTGLVFDHFKNASQSSTSGRTFYPREFSHDQGIKRTMKTTNELRNKKDLREKISLMKRLNKTSISPGVSGLLTANNNTRQADIAAHFVNQVEGIHPKDLGTGMESRCEEKQLHNTLSKIDLRPLKCLAAPDSNSDAWYIVVDLEVLLHEFKFLTTLTDSDEKCHLMVPKRVMEELKTYVTCTENIQAKRILRFLSQQIEIGYAYLAKEPSKVEGDSMADVILATCKELLDSKYHLILLSNDNDILNKGSSNINVFCIDDVKNFLMESSNKITLASPGPKMPFMTNELINKIKIIVPNDVPHNIDTSPRRDTQSSNRIDKMSPKQNNTPDKPDELIVLKHTVDAGIQTDLEEIYASTVNVVEKQPPNAVSFDFESKETITRRSVASVSNTPGKKREILLKRSTSHQPTTNSVETEKKQFKWRRRRNTSQGNEKIRSNNNQNNTNNVESQSNTLNNEILYNLPDRTLNNNSATRIENKISDESIESKDSSIYAEPNATTEENVTIGKTSTSGIISNTESNIDDDRSYSNSTNSINQQPVYNKDMYEVESITMEQYLRTKCDEWVSRFIQIMEEVLSQVLQEDPTFTHKAMPPPWTLHEAAQCIVIKFRGHQDITAAANRLSNILFQVSDAKGKIIEMTPVQYMQMYSYSVHLLDAIMEVVTGCEDIQIAVESLNKLLYDIRKPNMESSNNNVFSEDRQDDISNYDVSAYTDVPSNSDDDEISLHEQEMLLERSCTEEERNDKPEENISCEEELQKPIQFIRKIDIPFPLKKSFSCQRNNKVNKNKSPVQYRETQRSTVSQQGEGHNSQNASESLERGTDSDVPTNHPTIIRTFSKCPMLEQKLRNNNNEQRHDANGHGQTDKGADTTTPDGPESLNDADLIDENNKKFKYMMHTFLQEIKNALSQVQVLCDQCYQEFLEPEHSTAQKYQLQKKAERAQLHILRLSRSLESMLDHEANNPTQSMSALLEQADIDIHHVDAELLVGYRISVEKCKGYTDEFLSSIANIISDVTRFLGREAIDDASDLNSEKT